MTLIGTICYQQTTFGLGYGKKEEFNIFEAAIKGSVTRILRNNVKKNPGLVQATNQKGYTPLHVATVNGHLKMISYLLNAGANVNARNNYKQTPLHLAAGYTSTAVANWGTAFNNKDKDIKPQLQKVHNRISVLKLLVGSFADLDAKDEFGQTPLELYEKNVGKLGFGQENYDITILLRGRSYYFSLHQRPYAVGRR